MKTGTHDAVARDGSRIQVALAFCCMLTLFLTGRLLTQGLHPALNVVDPTLREVGVLANAAALVALALVATWRPALLAHGRYAMCALACLLAGAAGVIGGLRLGSPWLLAAACVAHGAGRALVAVLACAVCAQLPTRAAEACVAGAYLAALAAGLGCARIPQAACVVLFLAMPLATLALGHALGARQMEHALAAQPPSQAVITAPSTFLPFGHQLFVTLLLFRAVFGFALESGSMDLQAPATALVCVCVLAGVVGRCALVSTPLSHDRLFDASTLLVLGGALLMFAATGTLQAVAGGLIFAGVGCFEVMAYCVLMALARRNATSMVVVFAWGHAMYAAGVALGAFAGRSCEALAAVDAQAASLAAACVLFVFVAYAVVFMRGFSFAGTVQAVEAAREVAPQDQTSALEARCQEVAQAGGLTAREAEIFGLLAQGRNAAHIQERLVLSRNTVKVHVRHIYTKLGVHSQQELIDLVAR